MDTPKMQKAPAKKKAKPVPKVEKYYCPTSELHHPYQGIWIRDIPVMLERDSWLELQIEAGLVKCQ